MGTGNRWSCVLKSFSIVTGNPEDELIDLVGHNGSEIIFPDLPEPLCRRGFDPREFVFPLYVKGIDVIQIDRYIERYINNNIYRIDNKHGLINALISNKGVLTGIVNGQHHAVAWVDGKIHDPNGQIYYLESFNPDCFYLVKASEAGHLMKATI